MEGLQVARGARQGAVDATDGLAGGSRHALVTVRDSTKISRESEDRGPAGRSERNPTAPVRRTRGRRAEDRAQRGPADPVTVILMAGLVAEVIVPWVAIGLSDWLVFDMPAWSLWLVFGVPPALIVPAALIRWALQVWSRQPVRVRASVQQGR